MTTLDEVDLAIDWGLVGLEKPEFQAKIYEIAWEAGYCGHPNPFPSDLDAVLGWVDGNGDREIERVTNA